jgi:hypothetical protein
MKLLLKRHPPINPLTGNPLGNLTADQENAFPSPDQLDVGELAINTISGKLYTKLLDGSVVEFVSQKICFEPSPEIFFFYENKPILPPTYLLEDYCCSGGFFTIVVDKLKPEPQKYKFWLQEITKNTIPEFIVLQEPSYDITSEIQNDQTITYRKATIPVSLKLLDEGDQFNNISLFQFKITDENDKLIKGGEKMLTIRCLESRLNLDSQ